MRYRITLKVKNTKDRINQLRLCIQGKFRIKETRFRKHQFYIIHRDSNHPLYIFNCLNNIWKRTRFIIDQDHLPPCHLGRLCRLRLQSQKSLPSLTSSEAPTKLSRPRSRNQQENMIAMSPLRLLRLAAVQCNYFKIQREYKLRPLLTHKTPKVRLLRLRSNSWFNR
jgi:hypothetical protein